MSIAEKILLEDGASGPAAKIAAALGRVASNMERVRAAAAGVRDIGPDLEKALATTERTKVAGRLAIEDTRKQAKLAAIDQANAGKLALQAQKLGAADLLAKNKAIAAVILEQAKAANALAANENKAAVQTERVAAAVQKATKAAPGGGKASGAGASAAGAGGGGRAPASQSSEASSKLSDLAGTLGVVLKTLGVIGAAVAGLTAAFLAASVSAAEFKSNTLGGLKAMLGSKEAAEDMYASIKKFAKESPFGKEEVAAGFKSLLGAGFSKADTEKILSGLFDVSALNNFDREVISSLSRALGQIKGKGKLMTEELNQIVEGSGGQVSRKAVFAEIATALKKPVGDVEKLLSTGKVSAEVGIEAIMETIRKNLSGGKLGALAKELGAQSLTGLASTLKDFATDMFESIDISPMKKVLAAIVDTLSGPAGDKLTSAITKLGTALFTGLFGGLDKGDKLTAIVEGVADAVAFVAEAVEMAAPYLKALGEGIMDGFGDVGKVLKDLFGGKSFDKKPVEGLVELFKTAGKGIAYIVSGIAAFAVFVGEGFIFLMGIVAAVVGVIGTVGSAIKTVVMAPIDAIRGLFSSEGPSIGSALVDGLVSGITAGISRVTAAITSMAQSAISAATSAFQIQSPSKVFAGLGVQLPAGAAMGVVAGTPMLERAVGSMASAGISAAAAPLNDNGAVMPGTAARGGTPGAGAALASGVEVNIDVSVSGSSPGAQEQAQAIGDELRPIIRSEISRALRRVA